MKSRAPLDPNTPSKYENALPPNIQDFFAYHDRYIAIKTGATEEEGEDWWMQLVEELREGIIARFKVHWKESSKTRTAFSGMNKDQLWQNEAEKVVYITRKIVATMDKSFVEKDLEGFIRSTIKDRIDPIRKELVAIATAILASDEEQEALRVFTTGDTFFFEDLGQHLVEQDAWRNELYHRFALVQYIHEWECFLLRVIKFEEANRNSSTRKGPIALTNLNARFRTAASQTIDAALAQLAHSIQEYQETHNKAFEVKGVLYQQTVERAHKAVAKVRTNFSGFTRDLLVLMDKATDEIEPLKLLGPVTQFVEGVTNGSIPFGDGTGFQFLEFADHTKGIFS